MKKKMQRKAESKKRPTHTDDFESVAKRLECDEDKERFEAKLGKLAKATPGSNKKRTA